jgi:hypothetical protein
MPRDRANSGAWLENTMCRPSGDQSLMFCASVDLNSISADRCHRSLPVEPRTVPDRLNASRLPSGDHALHCHREAVIGAVAPLSSTVLIERPSGATSYC